MTDLLRSPGRPGVFGALLDECARATIEMCELVESISEGAFLEDRESSDPDTVSLRSICTHCVNAAYGYSSFIRKVLEMEPGANGRLGATDLKSPMEFRGQMKRALQHTEDSIEPLLAMTDEEASKLTSPVSWGPTYDPEMILEHGIVHILRHRRQIERWNRK